jgi:hypothetical protein
MATKLLGSMDYTRAAKHSATLIPSLNKFLLHQLFHMHNTNEQNEKTIAHVFLENAEENMVPPQLIDRQLIDRQLIDRQLIDRQLIDRQLIDRQLMDFHKTDN